MFYLSDEQEMEYRKIAEKYIYLTQKTIESDEFINISSAEKKNRAIRIINEKFNKKIEESNDEMEKQLIEKMRSMIIDGIQEIKFKDLEDVR